MKLETFFEKFDLFADAPGAMAKMRELVLQLAVQGRLVDQVHDEEPVEQFLQRIWKDQTGGRLELTEAEKMQPFDIPSHWRWVALAEIAEFSIGKTPPRGDSSYWNSEGYNWVSIADMKHYGTITETKEKVSSSAAQDVFRLRFSEPGSILLSFKLTIGKVARTAIRCFHNEAIISLRPPEPELVDYLFRFLPIFATLQTSNNAIKGSTLNKSLLTLLPIALPPLAEQKRIVAKVDELMALCDRLEAEQKEREEKKAALTRASLARFAKAPTPANLNYLFHKSYDIAPADLRKTILTLAVQGKLIPFDTENKKQTVDDHIEFQNGYAFKSEWFKPFGIRLCRNVNVSHGVLDWSESAFVDDKIAKEFERFSLSEGDIVLSLDRPIITTGLKVARVRQADLPCLLLQRVAKPVPKHDQLNLSYFLLWLNSSAFLNAISPGRSNGVPHISTREVQRIPFTLPPFAEQCRIVAKVDQLMALVDELEAQLATSRVTGEKLLAALVAELTTLKKSSTVV